LISLHDHFWLVRSQSEEGRIWGLSVRSTLSPQILVSSR
jgi:hypothetical protein